MEEEGGGSAPGSLHRLARGAESTPESTALYVFEEFARLVAGNPHPEAKFKELASTLWSAPAVEAALPAALARERGSWRPL